MTEIGNRSADLNLYEHGHQVPRKRPQRAAVGGGGDGDAETGSPLECKTVQACTRTTGFEENQSLTLPVVMSSDHVSRFLALPCPYQPPWAEKIVVEVQKPPPPKPLRGPEAVPFY
nr:hypothetical protein DM860_004915 [Ipomoea batatas]